MQMSKVYSKNTCSPTDVACGFWLCPDFGVSYTWKLNIFCKFWQYCFLSSHASVATVMCFLSKVFISAHVHDCDICNAHQALFKI